MKQNTWLAVIAPEKAISRHKATPSHTLVFGHSAYKSRVSRPVYVPATYRCLEHQ